MRCDIPPGRCSPPGRAGHLLPGTSRESSSRCPQGWASDGKKWKEVRTGQWEVLRGEVCTLCLRSESFLFTWVNAGLAPSDARGPHLSHGPPVYGALRDTGDGGTCPEKRLVQALLPCVHSQANEHRVPGAPGRGRVLCPGQRSPGLSIPVRGKGR